MGCCQSDPAPKPRQLNKKSKTQRPQDRRRSPQQQQQQQQPHQRQRSPSPIIRDTSTKLSPMHNQGVPYMRAISQSQGNASYQSPPPHHGMFPRRDSSIVTVETNNGTADSRNRLLETMEKPTFDSYSSFPVALEAPRLGMVNPIENGLVHETPPPFRHGRSLTLEEGGRMLMSSQKGNAMLNRRIDQLTRSPGGGGYSPANVDSPENQHSFYHDDDNMQPTITYRNTMQESKYSGVGDPTLAQPTARANILFGIAMQGGDIEDSGIPVVKLRKAMECDASLRQSTGWPPDEHVALLDLLLDSSRGAVHGTIVTQTAIKHYCTCRWLFEQIDVRRKGEFTAWDLATALRDSADVSRELAIPPYLATPLFRQISPGSPTATLKEFFTYFHNIPLRFASEPIQSYKNVLERLVPVPDAKGYVQAAEIIDRFKADRYLQLELGWPDPASVIGSLGPTPTLEAVETLLKIRWAWSRADSAHDGFIGACELGDALEESEVARCLNRRVGDVKEVWRALDTSDTGVTMWYDFYRFFSEELKRKLQAPKRKAAVNAVTQAALMAIVVGAVARRRVSVAPQPSKPPVPTPQHAFSSPQHTPQPQPPPVAVPFKSPPTPSPAIRNVTPKHRSVTPPRPLPPPQPSIPRAATSEHLPTPKKPTKHYDISTPMFPQQPGDRYNRVKKLGEGNFGIVYLVERKSDGLQLVTKEPKRPVGSMTPQKKAADAKRMRKVQKEAAHLMRLKHPNILRFIEAYWEHGALVIVTEYCDGGDLAAWLTRHRSTASISTKWTIFQQIAEAIRYMHERSILHRDLKPANILLTTRGVVKLADFGLARALLPEEEVATTICGTELYMAPEVHNRMPYGMPADIFALGCILYQMAKGRKPYVNLLELLECKPPADAPKYSSRLVKDMLNSHPEARPSINQVLRRCPDYKPRRRQAKLLLLIWSRNQHKRWPEARHALRVLSYLMLLPY
eukprot:TRINITY_DN3360_c0_g1_i1.p1 TRINITY_DN3360_c0_g1~~TRINITY_DN3360_c0_g1_i1.p1  ORF type:complete len:972 (+),score=131.18 TRINITY_DN3360_c0_g1_i1:24-2918(+)